MAETKIVVTADTRQAERALGSLNNSLKALVSVAAITSLASQFIKLAEESTNLQNKMALVTQEGQTSNQLFLVMAKSAMMLGAPLKDVGDLFFRIANNTKDLGLAQTDQVKITETLIKGFQLTGASAGEVSGAVVQLGQAFAVGVLRGDELNSVLESLPMVSDALAAKFGVQRGALKALGEQGKITSKDLSDAILASGAAIDKAWANKIPTIAQSFNRMQTALTVAVGSFDQATGTSEAFSLAIIKVTIALVKVINFFEKWGSVIAMVAGGLALLILPVRAALAVISSLGSIVTTLIAPFVRLGTAIKNSGSMLTNFIGGIAAGATAGGVWTLGSAIKGLFSKDKTEAVDKFKQANEELAKVLGFDSVEAMNKAKAATGGLTAQQLKDMEAIRKATVDRDEDLKKLLRDQESELVLTKYIGDELKVQEAIYSANKSLVRAIKDDKGNTIGYTNALNAAEEAQLRTLALQSQELKRQQDIRQKLAAYRVPLAGSAAGADVAGQMPSLDPITAAQTANQTLYTGLQYLRDQDLISEQAYQTAKVNAAVMANAAIMDATKKQYENAAMLRIQSGIGAQFGYETQKQMAQEAANFEMKTTLEKTQFALEQGASIFSALGAQNKKAFEAAKAFNIANAIMNTYMGATKALATYPWPFGLVAAAAAVAAGMAQVNMIRSQQYSGRALGGPVMGGTSYIVGENGPELFTPNTTGSITRNGDLGGGGVTNINFNIQANDAQGFDDLLIQRRGMITQFVRDAMVEQGQRSKM